MTLCNSSVWAKFDLRPFISDEYFNEYRPVATMETLKRFLFMQKPNF